ncbi:hypothetical protein ON010_g16370 [Phytophthora cinnamomi]|nr:hypothetical protein ON010_g16370 [Phytophthora cinnamomi]
MTETCADDSPRAAPAAVQVVDGFFVPKAVVEDDATTPLPLFKRFEMVPASWSESSGSCAAGEGAAAGRRLQTDQGRVLPAPRPGHAQ